jgi:hypothetical protein
MSAVDPGAVRDLAMPCPICRPNARKPDVHACLARPASWLEAFALSSALRSGFVADFAHPAFGGGGVDSEEAEHERCRGGRRVDLADDRARVRVAVHAWVSVSKRPAGSFSLLIDNFIC